MSRVTKDTYDSFLESVLAKVPEDQREVVEQAFTHDAVAPILRDSVLARSDYSRSQDELAANRSALEVETAQAREQIAEWQAWYAEKVAEQEQLQSTVKAYEETYGSLDDLEGATTVTTRHRTDKETQTLSVDDVQSMLNHRDQLAIKFADLLTDLKIEHRERFGEKLDTEAVMAYATKQGKAIDVAYRELMAPKEKELADAELAEKLTQARNEGAREALSKHNLPVAPPHREIHVLDRQAEAQKDQHSRVQAAVARFNAALAR